MVTGLPVKIVVLTIVGLAALAVMLSSIPSCITPRAISARILGNDTIGLEAQEADFPNVSVKVTDRSGNPVEGATVIISGLGSGGYGLTDKGGVANVSSSGKISLSSNEGYLKLMVKPQGCYQEYTNEYAVKVYIGK